MRPISVLAALGLFSTANCRPEHEEERTVASSAPRGLRTDVEKREALQATLAGRRVTIAGEVEAILGPRAFTVSSEGSLAWREDIVVRAPAPITFADRALAPGDEVIVTGTVHPGLAGAEPELRAQAVRRVEDYARWSADDAERNTVGVLGLFEGDPRRLVGRSADLARARVEHVGPTTLWLGTEAARVLVSPPDVAVLRGLRAGDTVDVTGTIEAMPAPARARGRLGIGPEITDAELRASPIYIRATSIAPVARPAS